MYLSSAICCSRSLLALNAFSVLDIVVSNSFCFFNSSSFLILISSAFLLFSISSALSVGFLGTSFLSVFDTGRSGKY